jgi:RND family efflux transporter MFP subunit
VKRMARRSVSPSLAGLVIVAFAALVSCESAAPSRAPAPVASTSTMLVDTTTVDVARSYPSQVYVEHDVAVAARSAGVLDSLLVNLGSHVRAGATLAVVDSRAQQIEAARAHDRWERARNAMSRTRELAKSGSITRTDSEGVAGELRQAELNVQSADRALVLTRVTAPFEGVVTARYARPQQLVADGDTLLRVAETGPQLVRVRVGEPAAQRVRKGDRAHVRGSRGSARVAASVLFASPALDPASGTREVILRLVDPHFLVGESVTVELGSERRTVVTAPREAVSLEGFALVVQGDRTTMRPVTVGVPVPGDRVEIVSGLAAGERLAPLHTLPARR